MRRYEPRSRFPQKPPFRAHFRAFYPHPAHKSALERKGRPTSWHPGNVGGPPSPWPLFSRLTPHAPAPRSTLHVPRRDQRGQVVRRPSPAGYCLTPTAELPRIQRGPITPTGPPIFSMSPNWRFLRTNQSVSSPLAAAQPLTILSWPEALNASGSRRACRMAISRNACSLFSFLILLTNSRGSGWSSITRHKILIPSTDIAVNSAWRRVTINRLRLYTANGSSATRLAESRMSRCGPEDSESSDGEGTRPWPGDREQYSPLPTNTSALLVRVRPLTSRFRPASASLALTVDGWPDLENNPGDKTVSSRTGPRLGRCHILVGRVRSDRSASGTIQHVDMIGGLSP